MSFRIERSHVVFKHLIHVGPEINADTVSDFAIERDYSKSVRDIPTPTGLLKEHLFRPKSNPQSLIVFSSKGFVIDAQPSNNVLPLFRDAYDFYERVLGDDAMNATVLMDVNAQFDIFSPLPVKDFLHKVYISATSKLTFNGKSIYPYGITLSTGSGKFPEEYTQINIMPLPKDMEKRLLIIAIYKSTELDEALKFIEKIDESIIELLKKISKF